MLAVTCDKCRRRFTLADEELQGYLQQAESKKYTLVLCPHCGKGNKVARERLARAASGPAGHAPTGSPATEEIARPAPTDGQGQAVEARPPAEEQPPAA